MELQDKACSGTESNNINACLVWEDVTVVTRNLRNAAAKKLISGITGYVEANHIMAIMGPSGSGKSTLLDALAGRLSSNVAMSGKVLVGGKKRSMRCRDFSYATQEDVLLGTLTVRETLTYSARLRLPATLTKSEINKVVESTIIKMGLEDCADRKIGNWHLRGISGGEKRRLSISIEILTQPLVLFLDEPTTGLDSAASLFVIQALRNIAHEGRIVICSVHQPSSDVYNLFDVLFLLSGGETVYFGDSKKAINFFAEAGFPCPTRRNPPDHFLRCINSDFDKIIATLRESRRSFGISASSNSSNNLPTTEIKAMLITKYRSSEYSTNARKKMQEVTLNEAGFGEPHRRNPGWWSQLWVLTCRSSLNMSRDLGYYWFRLAFFILVSISAGTLFFHIGTSNHSIGPRGMCIGFIYGLMICLSIGGLPSFMEEVKFCTRERHAGHYGAGLYVLSNFFSSSPFLVAIAVCSAAILYNLVKFHPGISQFCFFCLNLFLCIAVTEGSVLVVSVIAPTMMIGIGTSAAFTVFMMMPSNLFRRLPDLPKVFWYYPMSFISYASWSVEGQYKNDMIGLEFDPPKPGQPKLKGEMLLQDKFGIDPDFSKWWDIAALFCLLVSMRALFFLTLRYNGRASSVFHRLFTKTMEHPIRIPS